MMGNILITILAFTIGAGSAFSARAADASAHGVQARTSLVSDWVTSRYAATRLISAQTIVGPRDTYILLGFQVNLQPGWKTYWRSPGEAGVAPRWHWAQASNVSDVAVAWPLPKRASAFGVDEMVYEHQVVIPMTLKLSHPGRAVALDLRVDYSVCEKICVPLQGRYRLDIPATGAASGHTPEAALIGDYVRRVPQQVGVQGAAPLGVKITGLRLAGSGANARLEFEAVGDKSMQRGDVFVEGPDTLGFGSPSRRQGKAAGLTHFAVPVYSDGLNVAEVLARSPLVLTVSDGNGNAAEYRLKVK